MTKRAYKKPIVSDHGTLTEITAGAKTGNFVDKTFPVNTPIGKITFS